MPGPSPRGTLEDFLPSPAPQQASDADAGAKGSCGANGHAEVGRNGRKSFFHFFPGAPNMRSWLFTCYRCQKWRIFNVQTAGRGAA